MQLKRQIVENETRTTNLEQVPPNTESIRRKNILFPRDKKRTWHCPEVGNVVKEPITRSNIDSYHHIFVYDYLYLYKLNQFKSILKREAVLRGAASDCVWCRLLCEDFFISKRAPLTADERSARHGHRALRGPRELRYQEDFYGLYMHQPKPLRYLNVERYNLESAKIYFPPLICLICYVRN